ncbi:dihydropyrimidinase [Leptolyngbya sp. FACHB-711]|uniref:dihydropyrimidinase n=1 Tax=unclassified Leptolyngbya TaxID=2650499 RepID=UPI0016878C24|nr:dihydropyrimidinase [Leptolyngbya sp. FACHB-711]MBD1849239.1 dihydropyrimidinase [Cyanobacteria bacterium FACHB-502]MBD2023600.1 dihydropyrimidinase [Leptolyngbya sp. FACHB-711]
MTETLIQGGRIITAVDDYRADILIKDGRIDTIAREIHSDTATVHDASNLFVLPGGVDVHTHMEFPLGSAETCDTFETGTRSAAFGGTTTIIDFALQKKGETPKQTLDQRLAVAQPKACVDYSFHLILTHITPQTLAELPDLINRDGISSFKMFMAYPGVLMVEDADIFRSMRTVGNHGGMINLHAENGGVIQVLIEEALAQGNTSPKYHSLTRPRIMEAEATHRAIRLAELAEIPVYIVHLSAKEALDAVVEARDRGIEAYAETCPHYLFLTIEEYDRPGFEAAKFVMTPPLREADCQHALWRGLKFDDLQIVSTDHCPFCFNENPFGINRSKQLGRDNFEQIPNGAPGVELRIPLLFDGGVLTHRLSLNRFVQLTATAPAKMFGLFPRKGTIAVGSDADIILFDPQKSHIISASTHHSNVDYSLYEGRLVTGKVEKVFLRGKLIVDGDQWYGTPGSGQFLRRSASGRV